MTFKKTILANICIEISGWEDGTILIDQGLGSIVRIHAYDVKAFTNAIKQAADKFVKSKQVVPAYPHVVGEPDDNVVSPGKPVSLPDEALHLLKGYGIEDSLAREFIAHRARYGLTVNQRVIDNLASHANESDISLSSAIRFAIDNSLLGIEDSLAREAKVGMNPAICNGEPYCPPDPRDEKRKAAGILVQYPGVDESLAINFIEIRQYFKLGFDDGDIKDIAREAALADITIEAAIRYAVDHFYPTFLAVWYQVAK